MMELKVWVDGLQRVVCGASLDTTCQDVVIALAHAMGRTGRFTLVEKWRDNDRPLTPTECPLRVLHKWGEYAAEVRFVLCQADTDPGSKPRLGTTSQDKLAKAKSGSLTDRPWYPPHRHFAPHPQMQALLTGGGGEANVKRSLTFSGAHGNGPPSSAPGAWLNSSAPTSKFRKTHLGPVPNGDVKRPLAGTALQQHPPVQSFQRPAARTEGVGRGGGGGVQQPSPDQQQTSHQHPIPSPRRRHSPKRSRDPLHNNSAFQSVPTSSLSLPSDHDDRHPHTHPQSIHGNISTQPQPHSQSSESRTAPPQPPASHPQSSSTSQGMQPYSHSHAQSHPYPQPQHSHAPPSSSQGTHSQHPHPSSSHPQSHPQQTHPQGSQEPYSHPQSKLPHPHPTHQHHQPHHQSDFHPHRQHHSSHSHHQQHQQSSKDEQVHGQAHRTHLLVASHPTHSQPHTVRAPSPLAPPLPSSPPPLHANPDLLTAERVSLSSPVLGSPSDSREANIELEEYDLDRNFPETHRDSSNRGGGGGGGVHSGGAGGSDLHPTVSLEYRLEDGVGSGSGGQGHLMEGEHAKLLRLVNMQQERLKTQESQISLINTDITALEEQEKEYEDKLQAIMEELLLHENRQRELEPQLQELEKVEWENVMDGEKKCEIDLTLKIATCKAQILEHEQKLEDVKKKEADLLDELKAEEEKITQERERLKAEEARARDEENKTKEEITGLQSEFAQLQKRASELGTSLSSVSEELQATEQELDVKSKELEDMEEQLKDENMKDFAAHPVPKEEDLFKSKTNSGEAIIKILEGRLSPRPGSVSSKALENPSSPPFISALSAKNQSGVWV